jgi:GNAT superfamily N-acetyltransferase
MDHLAKELKMIVDPDLVIFLELDGEPIGVAVTIPDINQVLARFNGRLFPTGIFHLLRRKKIINRARLVMLGVVPEYRNKGFDLLLIHEIVARAKVNGIVEGECGWTLEDNDSINHGIEAAGGVRNKTYRIYQKQL